MPPCFVAGPSVTGLGWAAVSLEELEVSSNISRTKHGNWAFFLWATFSFSRGHFGDFSMVGGCVSYEWVIGEEEDKGERWQLGFLFFIFIVYSDRLRPN